MSSLVTHEDVHQVCELSAVLHVVVGSVSHELVPVTAQVFNETAFTFILFLFLLDFIH